MGVARYHRCSQASTRIVRTEHVRDIARDVEHLVDGLALIFE